MFYRVSQDRNYLHFGSFRPLLLYMLVYEIFLQKCPLGGRKKKKKKKITKRQEFDIIPQSSTLTFKTNQHVPCLSTLQKSYLYLQAK